MPLYDYKCPRCGRVEEHQHGMNESKVYFCAHGHSAVHMDRVISAPAALVFKGPGFHVNDYPKK